MFIYFSKDLHAALKQDISAYSQQGEVLLVGYFNDRTVNHQGSIICCKEDHNPIWLTEEENPQWVRCSKDDKVRNHFGEELLTLCGAFNLIICNGLDSWNGLVMAISNSVSGSSTLKFADVVSAILSEEM